jgi:hypothetical protein
MKKLCKPSPPSSPSNSHQWIQMTAFLTPSCLPTCKEIFSLHPFSNLTLPPMSHFVMIMTAMTMSSRCLPSIVWMIALVVMKVLFLLQVLGVMPFNLILVLWTNQMYFESDTMTGTTQILLLFRFIHGFEASVERWLFRVKSESRTRKAWIR